MAAHSHNQAHISCAPRPRAAIALCLTRAGLRGRRLGPLRHRRHLRVGGPSDNRKRRRQLVDQAAAGAAGLQAAPTAGEDGRPQEDRHRRRNEHRAHAPGPGESSPTPSRRVHISLRCAVPSQDRVRRESGPSARGRRREKPARRALQVTLPCGRPPSPRGETQATANSVRICSSRSGSHCPRKCVCYRKSLNKSSF